MPLPAREYARLLAELTLAYGALARSCKASASSTWGKPLVSRTARPAGAALPGRMADQVTLWRRLRRPTPDAPLPASGLAVDELPVAAPLATVITLLQAELGSRFAHVVTSQSPLDGAPQGRR
ncbi:MAG: hypothetical protein HZY76_05780 [Anaerolineae bacterium]|nr:MAG: hypothetical protein HZY76_05780 [Anaerolineae bacterium]